MRKLVLKTLAICAGSSLLLTTGLADDKLGKGEYKTHYKLMQTSKILGATVQDRQGQTIGEIEDLVLFPHSGQIQFGLLSLDLPEHDGKLTAVPWQLLRHKEGNVYMFTADREKLLSAKMWDSSASVDFDRDFARRTYAHYGLDWDERMAVGGRVIMPGGVETGIRGEYIEEDEGTEFKRPQPDGRSTFPQLNPEEKEP